MTVNDMLTSSAIGAFFGALFSFLTNWILRRIDFFNEYSKFIIEKRKKAYDYIEPIISSFDERIHIKRGDEIMSNLLRILIFEHDKISYSQEITERLGSYKNYKFWFGKELDDGISELFQLLLVIEKTEKNFTENAVHYLNEQQFEEKIKTLSEKLNSSYFNDLLKLYDIKEFMKLKKSN